MTELPPDDARPPHDTRNTCNANAKDDAPEAAASAVALGAQAIPMTQPAEKPVSVTVNMPRQRRRWLATLLGICILIIIYLAALLAGLTTGPFDTEIIIGGNAQGEKIAVWEINGVIDGEAAERFERFVREIKGHPEVKAVVVRMDSPGGEVSPSDRMNRALAELSASGLTTVVSMGTVAASGGYYVSAAADWIYAEPSTITGSIGVISMTPVIKGAADLLGIDFVVIRSTASKDHKAALNYFESPSTETIEAHRQLLDGIQEQFIAAVARGRKTLGLEGVAPLADGRVWLGGEAATLGLVDEVGYFDEAVDKAASLAGLTNPHVVKFTKRQGLRSALLSARADAGVKIDPALVEQLTGTRVLLLWRP